MSLIRFNNELKPFADHTIMLPWVEKHRPHTLDELMMDDPTRTLFRRMIETKTFPHMLFYGPPGTGKTSTILCILQQLKQKFKQVKYFKPKSSRQDSSETYLVALEFLDNQMENNNQ